MTMPRHSQFFVAGCRRRSRRGFTIVIMAIAMLALFAMLALVLDLSRAMLMRRQMQASVNSAAMDGLRFRDDIPEAWRDATTAPTGLLETVGVPPAVAYDLADPDWRQYIDRARRWSAANLGGQALFAPDHEQSLARVPKVSVAVNPNNSFPPFLQTIDPADLFDDFPRPVMQANLDTDGSQIDPGGDLVGGAFDASDAAHVETHLPTYARTDFTEFGDSSSSTGYHSDANSAFVARLRRTGEDFNGSDGSRTASQRMPLLFGIGVKDSTSGEPLQAIVRATAVADSQPALSIGPMFYRAVPATAGIQWTVGAAPFVISPPAWQSLGTLQTQTPGAGIYLQSTGQVTTDAAGTIPLFQVTGVSQLNLDNGNTVVVNSTAGDSNYHIGQLLTGLQAQSPPSINVQAAAGQYRLLAYVPIVVQDANSTVNNRVVGFHSLQITVPAAAVEVDPNGQTGLYRISASAAFPLRLTYTLDPLTLGPENCSAALTSRFAADFAAVFASAEYQVFVATRPFLMAPGLVRSLSLPSPPTVIQQP